MQTRATFPRRAPVETVAYVATTIDYDQHELETAIREGQTLTVSQPFTISFDPGSLNEFQ